ncbi:Hypothetical protein HP17_08454 [Helicobacter pylori NCTC 11637 = CCUG 17874 = ATCC 43504 = JCM 12093]|nr:Hypothetical protein HP17_08454 [Helicobacter pylori NCTC 11637 = CCUG 17874 = ATCC 43504 = JCM 12093]
MELKNQSFNNIPPLLLALRLYLRGDLEGVGIEIKGTEEDEKIKQISHYQSRHSRWGQDLFDQTD